MLRPAQRTSAEDLLEDQDSMLAMHSLQLIRIETGSSQEMNSEESSESTESLQQRQRSFGWLTVTIETRTAESPTQSLWRRSYLNHPQEDEKEACKKSEPERALLFNIPFNLPQTH